MFSSIPLLAVIGLYRTYPTDDTAPMPYVVTSPAATTILNHLDRVSYLYIPTPTPIPTATAAATITIRLLPPLISPASVAPYSSWILPPSLGMQFMTLSRVVVVAGAAAAFE